MSVDLTRCETPNLPVGRVAAVASAALNALLLDQLVAIAGKKFALLPIYFSGLDTLQD